jgi:hypothetical protein
LTVLGVDAEDRDPDLVADPEDAESKEPWHQGAPAAAGERQTWRRRHLEGGVIAALDVVEDELERAAGRAPPAAAPGGIVARGRRGWAVIRRQLAFVATVEERRPRLPIVGVEAWIGELLVRHGLEDLVDGSIVGGSRRRRRDRDTTGAQAPSSGRPEVRRRHPPGARKSGGAM